MFAKQNILVGVAIAAIIGSLVAITFQSSSGDGTSNSLRLLKGRNRVRKHNLFAPRPEPQVAEDPVVESPQETKAEKVISGPPIHANNTVLCNRIYGKIECEEGTEADGKCEWKEFPNKNKKHKGSGMCKRKPDISRRLDADEADIHINDDLDQKEVLDYHVCDRVLPPRIQGYSPEENENCEKYESLPLIIPDCSERAEIVPRILHSVSRDAHQSYHQTATSMANPSFERNHHSDASALEYVRSKCGEEAAMAYSCFIPPAYRADLFRFCAMYADGGIYLDADIVPLLPIDHMYSDCSTATLGHDFPQATPGHDSPHEGKQMKIIASAPGAPIFKCALDSVIDHVRTRYIPEGSLMITGPNMLHQCYEKHPEDVAITYHDTRGARWPYTGLRAGDTILAYELPSSKIFKALREENDDSDYAYLFEQKKIYSDTCPLEN